MTKKCFECDGKNGAKTSNLYGYPICDVCKSKLKLLSDKTIQKYHSENPKKFAKEIERRLDFLGKDYISKKIKLLHVKENLKNIK